MVANPEYINTNSTKEAVDIESEQHQDSNMATEGNNRNDAVVMEDVGDEVDRGIILHAGDVPDGLPGLKKKRKNKKKNRSAGKRGLGKPTGFEEYHADGPLTAEQVLELKEEFHPDVPFVDRILKAIQRFERTRKLSPERRDVFYKYLAYGGVEIGPNMFMGAQEVNDMDKDNVNATLAQTSISDDTKKSILDPKQVEGEEETLAANTNSGNKLFSEQHLAKYVVDFEGTIRGFLARQAPSLFLFDTQDGISMVTTTLERFMDFLLQHEVCPEYTAEVLNTRNLCRTARTELWHCAEAQRHLPDDFNIACSTLFGGSYARNYDSEISWQPDHLKADMFVGLDLEKATQIIGFAIAGAATEDVYSKYLEIANNESAGEDFDVIQIIDGHGFEIIKLEPPTKECRTFYREHTSEFRPVGVVYAKCFQNPNAPPEDLTAGELYNIEASRSNTGNIDAAHHKEQDLFVFFIEAKPLFSFLKPGMRIEATIHKLNCGVWFFDEVLRVFPPFDLWLENELMLGWKEPRPVAGISDTIWNVGGANSTAADSKADGEGVTASDHFKCTEQSNTVDEITLQSDGADGNTAEISRHDEDNTDLDLTCVVTSVDNDESQDPY